MKNGLVWDASRDEAGARASTVQFAYEPLSNAAAGAVRAKAV
jgi:hypothetical protein